MKKKKKKTISLCMIVKNEEKYLEACLNSVKDFVSEIIIVDTGSTDNTLEIAKKFKSKLFYYEWDNSFCRARNFSINKATGDWILILDGDEIFERADQDKLLHFINTTTSDCCHFWITNYSGDEAHPTTSLHYSFRLLRNNKKYHFVGDIHEQIAPINGTFSKDAITTQEIRLHHYGYLNKVIEAKDKRSRNIPLILKQLESDPDNPFYLFNLANEYLASNDFENALEIFEKAYPYIKPQHAFVSHFYYRMSMCLYTLHHYQRALEIATEGLTYYPLCTDLEFCKSTILYAMHKYTLAIASLNRCLEMGEPPARFKFSNGCGTFRPYMLLGEIYAYLDDLDHALVAFNKAMSLEPSLFGILYQIGHILREKYQEEDLIVSKFASYFTDLEHTPNLVVFIDILIKEQLYSSAEKYIFPLTIQENQPLDIIFLDSKLKFFRHEYEAAYAGFKTILSSKDDSITLEDIKLEATKFSLTCAVLTQKSDWSDTLTQLDSFESTPFKKFSLALTNFQLSPDTFSFPEENDTEAFLLYLSDFLDILLKLNEHTLVEKYVPLLEQINSTEKFLILAKVYYINGYRDLAVQTLFRSIKEFDRINHESLDILSLEI